MLPSTLEKTLVVVPTYNEAGNVTILIESVRRLAPGIRMLFVDDNSQDQTRRLIEAQIEQHPDEIFLIKRERKLGLGTAYVTAFKWALARQYQTVIEMDADLSHRPEDLVSIAGLAQQHPVVIGSRYIEGGGTENWGIARQFISRLGSLYARLVLQIQIRDLTGGFNAWNRQVLEKIGLDNIRSEGYSFQIELKFRAQLAGFPLLETPILFVERRAGHSKMSGRIVLEAIGRVWGLAAQRREIRAAMTLPQSTLQKS